MPSQETIEIKDVRGRLCRLDIDHVVLGLIRACIKRNEEIVDAARAEISHAESRLEKCHIGLEQVKAIKQSDLPQETKNQLQQMIVDGCRSLHRPEKILEKNSLDFLSSVFCVYSLQDMGVITSAVMAERELACIHGDGI